MYLLIPKNATVSTQLFSLSWPQWFSPQLFSQLSYKMRITNHQSLGDPKFPVKPCTPESTSRRDPRTSVVRWGLDFNPRGCQLYLGKTVLGVGFLKGWFTYQFPKLAGFFGSNENIWMRILARAIFLVDGVLFCFRILEAEIYQTWNALFMLVKWWKLEESSICSWKFSQSNHV